MNIGKSITNADIILLVMPSFVDNICFGDNKTIIIYFNRIKIKLLVRTKSISLIINIKLKKINSQKIILSRNLKFAKKYEIYAPEIEIFKSCAKITISNFVPKFEIFAKLNISQFALKFETFTCATKCGI